MQSLVRIGHPNERCLPAVNTAAQCPTAAPVGAVIHKASPIFSLFFLLWAALWAGNFRDIAYFRTLFAAAEVPVKTNRQPDVGNRHHENAKTLQNVRILYITERKARFLHTQKYTTSLNRVQEVNKNQIYNAAVKRLFPQT